MTNKVFEEWLKESKRHVPFTAYDMQKAFEAGQKSISLEGDEHIIWMHGYQRGKEEAEKRVAERCLEIYGEDKGLNHRLVAQYAKQIKKEFLDE